CCFNNNAVTDESTPPLIPTTIRLFSFITILFSYFPSRWAISAVFIAASVTFSVVFAVPKLKRMELLGRSLRKLNIAFNTCEGSTDRSEERRVGKERRAGGAA